MVVSMAPVGYRIELDAAEREALLTALELVVGIARGDHANALKSLHRDAVASVDALDGMADRLFLCGAPS